MLLTTHYLDEAERLCDRLVLIDHGKVIVEGTPGELIHRHVGSAVLEAEYVHAVREPEPEALAAIERAGLDHDFAEGVLTVYGAGAPSGGVEAALASVPTPTATARSIRKGSLEDVFLRIAGHEIRGDEA